MSLIKPFEELGRQDVPLAGGKGANLGEMMRAGLPVPPGFVVTVDAYQRFYEQSGVDAAVSERLQRLDVDDPAQLRDVSEALQGLIRRARVPDEVRQAIAEAYKKLSQQQGVDAELVAVRSSATMEDTAQFSFAGMFQSFLNVRGEDELVRQIKACWASLFGARVLFYRIKQGLLGKQLIAVIVQKMVNANKSGVLFTVDPATNNPKVLVIEAAWGLGEVVVGGQVTPDRYEVDKESLSLIEKQIGRKDFMLIRDQTTSETVRVDLPEDKASAQVLTEQEVRALSELGKRDEQHYRAPQDAEWAIENGKMYLVQTRPVTTLIEKARRMPEAAKAEVLLHGLGASPGSATGIVRVLATAEEADKLEPGDVLVTVMTAPDWVPLMRRAAAIVTDAGGMTSHAAIVSRELGVPCIVGTRDATKVLKNGMTVTVNAREGTVVRGALPEVKPPPTVVTPPAPAAAPALVTATKLYVNLGEPELAEQVAQLPVDGVGLLRAEFMILAALQGVHPRKLLEEKRGGEFVTRMVEKLRIFARAFHPRPVIYRTMDFRSNEFRGLQGGEQYEPKEDNPMIGYRGCYRYTKESDLFALELEALKKVREEFENLHVMIPFVRTGWEFRECKQIIDESGLTGRRGPQLWVMAEVPSVLYWMEDYVRLGVTGISIGSNDLTQLMLGVDRDSQICAPLFDERDKAVLQVIQAIIQECKRLRITSSICGQAPSVYPEYAEMLVRWGIDSISVNPDVISRTRQNIAAAEQKLILEEARQKLAS